MPRFTYTGAVEQVYPNYLDEAKGSTLVAEPGATYDVAQVTDLTVPDGRGGMAVLALPMPPDDRWTAAKRDEKKKETG